MNIRIERTIWNADGSQREHHAWIDTLVRDHSPDCVVLPSGFLHTGECEGSWGRMVTTWTPVADAQGLADALKACTGSVKVTVRDGDEIAVSA